MIAFNSLHHYRYVLLCISLGFCLPIETQAGVFQCVKVNGEIEYRDRPCAFSNEEQSFLPHQYQKTDKKLVQVQEKKLQKNMQEQTKLNRKEERLQQRAEKKREKEQAAAERRKLRCKRLEEKITRLELQLQQGKKLKTYKRLEADLAQTLLMQKRYCSTAAAS